MRSSYACISTHGDHRGASPIKNSKDPRPHDPRVSILSLSEHNYK